MFRIQGTETDTYQGIHIIHDEYHTGYLSIQGEDHTPTFSIHSSPSTTTIRSSSELRLDVEQLVFPELHHNDMIPRQLVIDQNGRIFSQSSTYTLSSTIWVLIVGIQVYSILSTFM